MLVRACSITFNYAKNNSERRPSFLASTVVSKKRLLISNLRDSLFVSRKSIYKGRLCLLPPLEIEAFLEAAEHISRNKKLISRDGRQYDPFLKTCAKKKTNFLVKLDEKTNFIS